MMRIERVIADRTEPSLIPDTGRNLDTIRRRRAGKQAKPIPELQNLQKRRTMVYQINKKSIRYWDDHVSKQVSSPKEEPKDTVDPSHRRLTPGTENLTRSHMRFTGQHRWRVALSRRSGTEEAQEPPSKGARQAHANSQSDRSHTTTVELCTRRHHDVALPEQKSDSEPQQDAKSQRDETASTPLHTKNILRIIERNLRHKIRLLSPTNPRRLVDTPERSSKGDSISPRSRSGKAPSIQNPGHRTFRQTRKDRTEKQKEKKIRDEKSLRWRS
ncbi:hypothetical protein DY000_02019035 [Brassica cretica]|uniref:Uncharacterized protein n=1 Tax=Brassica cretica TaxID=69181 RepID=A0ABQ7DB42_BRACR|nr:hypothetical protein DY000_02019035 [Brassica cretica]